MIEPQNTVLEGVGTQFICENSGEPGVRLKLNHSEAKRSENLENESAIQEYDNVPWMYLGRLKISGRSEYSISDQQSLFSFQFYDQAPPNIQSHEEDKSEPIAIF